jgi:hypothetical protein
VKVTEKKETVVSFLFSSENFFSARSDNAGSIDVSSSGSQGHCFDFCNSGISETTDIRYTGEKKMSKALIS